LERFVEASIWINGTPVEGMASLLSPDGAEVVVDDKSFEATVESVVRPNNFKVRKEAGRCACWVIGLIRRG